MAFSGDPGKVLIATAASDTYSGRLVIDHIRWVQGATAGDQAIVKDGLGNVIFEAKISAANAVINENYQGGMLIDGIDVDTLGSGTLIFAMR